MPGLECQNVDRNSIGKLETAQGNIIKNINGISAKDLDTERIIESTRNNENKPVGDRDHEVLGMGSFGEYTHLYAGIK
jgi:hypothetical protein